LPPLHEPPNTATLCQNRRHGVCFNSISLSLQRKNTSPVIAATASLDLNSLQTQKRSITTIDYSTKMDLNPQEKKYIAETHCYHFYFIVETFEKLMPLDVEP
jgi:hypothetical protein